MFVVCGADVAVAAQLGGIAAGPAVDSSLVVAVASVVTFLFL